MRNLYKERRQELSDHEEMGIYISKRGAGDTNGEESEREKEDRK